MSVRYPRRLAVVGIIVFLFGGLLIYSTLLQPPRTVVPTPAGLTYEEKIALLGSFAEDSGAMDEKKKAATLNVLGTSTSAHTRSDEEKLGTLRSLENH